MNGLTWGTQADGTSSWNNNNAPQGTAPTGAVAYLTDIIGERTVTVRAQTTISGVSYQRDLVVTFGKGPMSVFASAPVPGLSYASQDTIASFLSLTPSSGFPASNSCGGTLPVNYMTLTTPPPGAVIDYNPAYWTERGDGITGRLTFFSSYIRLPIETEAMYVSGYDSSIYPQVPRKGAAKAAGWSTGNQYWMRTFTVNTANQTGNITAHTFDLNNGNGDGFPPTTATPYTVCVK
jgi:hypothetical protein